MVGVIPMVSSLFLLAGLTGCGGGGGSGSTVSVTVPSTAAVSGAGSTAASKHAVPGAHTTEQAPGAPASGAATTPGGATAATSTPSASAAPQPSGRLLRRFTGSGNGRLGTIVVSTPATLIWRAQRGAIQIFTSSGFLLVQSQTPNGSVRLSKGTYRGVRVASHTSWAIELRARAS